MIGHGDRVGKGADGVAGVRGADGGHNQIGDRIDGVDGGEAERPTAGNVAGIADRIVEDIQRPGAVWRGAVEGGQG